MSNQRTASIVIIVSFIFCLVFILVGCGAQIVGQVLDGFGAPLKDVAVSIEDTTFKTTTNSNGKYSIGYVPGKIKVVIAKEGYTSTNLSLDIANESTFPAKSVVLYKIPATQGIWFFGESDYIPLTRGKIAFSSEKFPFSWNKPLSQETNIAKGEFTSIEKSTTFKFLDNDKNNIELYKLTDDGLILSRTIFYTETKDNAQILKDKCNKIAEDVFVREISLEKGKYAFVRSSLFFVTKVIGEPIYLFEIK
jgi:hypothetical protein